MSFAPKSELVAEHPQHRLVSSDAIDVAHWQGYSAHSDMSVRLACFVGCYSLFDQAGVVLGGAGHLLIKS